MVTGELKSKIDSLWEIFWTGGLTNPLDVIEQMTYLMFIQRKNALPLCAFLAHQTVQKRPI